MRKFQTRWANRNYPVWKQYLVPRYDRSQDWVYLEIGAFEGRSACWMLDNIFQSQGSVAYLIDTFGGPSRMSHVESIRKYGGKIEATCRQNMAPFGERVSIIKGDSDTVLRSPEILSLTGEVDLVYVDGAHHGDSAYRDACLAWELVREGTGIMMWDDIHLPDVSDSLERFMESHGGRLDVIWREKYTCGFRRGTNA